MMFTRSCESIHSQSFMLSCVRAKYHNVVFSKVSVLTIILAGRVTLASLMLLRFHCSSPELFAEEQQTTHHCWVFCHNSSHFAAVISNQASLCLNHSTIWCTSHIHAGLQLLCNHFTAFTGLMLCRDTIHLLVCEKTALQAKICLNY